MPLGPFLALCSEWGFSLSFALCTHGDTASPLALHLGQPWRREQELSLSAGACCTHLPSSGVASAQRERAQGSSVASCIFWC